MARKRRNQVKISISRVSVAIIAINLIGFLILYLSLRLGNTLPDNFKSILSGIGTFNILGFALCFIVSLKSMSWHEFSLIGRLLSLFLSLLNLLAWVGLYLLGIMTYF